MNLTSFDCVSNVYVPRNGPEPTDFELLYLSVRQKEQRLFSDPDLFRLPEVPQNHPHHAEWQVRKQSCQRLIRYLEAKRSILNILEIGCGNGWLSHEMSRIPGSKVIGIDINLSELRQGARVFTGNSKLKFVCGDLRSGMLLDLRFDIIVFAASMQYFPDVAEILEQAYLHLYPGGEIHMLDSPWYKNPALASAKARTREYYLALGFPEMTAHYFHLCWDDLRHLPYEKLYDPESVRSRILGQQGPFPWICLKKPECD